MRFKDTFDVPYRSCAIFLCAFTLWGALVEAQEIVEPTAPATGGPSIQVARSYLVGEADVLRINVWKQPELSQSSVVVRPDGIVSVPLVGEIRVSGMTPVQIEALLV